MDDIQFQYVVAVYLGGDEPSPWIYGPYDHQPDAAELATVRRVWTPQPARATGTRPVARMTTTVLIPPPQEEA